jgi:hypothetical protein
MSRTMEDGTIQRSKVLIWFREGFTKPCSIRRGTGADPMPHGFGRRSHDRKGRPFWKLQLFMRPPGVPKKWHKVAGFWGVLCHFAGQFLDQSTAEPARWFQVAGKNGVSQQSRFVIPETIHLDFLIRGIGVIRV